ncbi:tetratricopeptide repeat protein [Stratiformator vulcanicus]|uniref:Tetratricopeptide repeat protein n=1 Tax=Stratiformator vulcanicus TaxID=2527980 RepID=A0A517QVW9_9PLAN|nr:tetratricopeptide repeat protein [Stratiformator vulcanicus]QDT35760.1 Tetratricopeptide repeat protein [Stratiformator vulcanicus]
MSYVHLSGLVGLPEVIAVLLLPTGVRLLMRRSSRTSGPSLAGPGPGGVVAVMLSRWGSTSGAVAIAALGAGTLWSLRRRPALAFLGIWFFLTLAPTSSFVPILTEVGAERRMYLPLMSIAIAFSAMLLVSCRWLGGTARLARPLYVAMIAVTSALFVGVSASRCEVYESRTRIWNDAVRALPGNDRAWNNLVDALIDAGEPAKALPAAKRLIQLVPENARANYQLGRVLRMNKLPESAIPALENSVTLAPGNAGFYLELGNAYRDSGNESQAIATFEKTIKLDPTYSEAYNNLATLVGRTSPETGLHYAEQAMTL